MRHTLAAFAALSTLLAACGSPQPQAATVPVETPTSAPTSAAPTTPAQQPVGRTQTSAGGSDTVEVTVLRLRQPFPPTIPGLIDRKGYEYAGLEVKVCVTRNGGESPTAVSWSPWSLSYASGVVVEAASSWSPEAWDEPLYPQDHIVRQGRCARGWIPFEVRAKDGRPALVSYTPSTGASLEWRVASS
ncbi:hypothetical protein ABZ912_20215 [Nonomuraea angiospora]|uniref:hypothetical protein n=1 Tax=Nonomuraea angiospora TaxID=46172 RepID=UPI0033D7F2A0